METKLFATTLADALHSGRLLYAGAVATFVIVEVTIPAALEDQFDRFMADRMPTIAVYPEQLATFNRAATVRFLNIVQEQ